MLPFPPASSEADWAPALARAAAAGFDLVEMTDTWLRVGDLSDEQLDALMDAARANGLDVPAVALIRGSVIATDDGATNLAYSHRSIDAAARLGAEVVSVGLHEPLTADQRTALWFWLAPGRGEQPDVSGRWELAVRRLRDLGRHAADVGLLLALEMYEDTYLGTADSAVRLVTDIGLDNVGLNPDTGNLLRLHRPVEPWRDVLEKTLPYATYWHVKNYLRDEDPATGAYFTVPTSLELGLIDYRTSVQLAASVGFDGVITCEHYGGDALGVSASNARYLRSVLADVPLPTAAAPA